MRDAMAHGAAALGKCPQTLRPSTRQACRLLHLRSAPRATGALCSSHGCRTQPRQAGVQTKATIKQGKADQFVDRTLDRSVLWEMHTPQARRAAADACRRRRRTALHGGLIRSLPPAGRQVVRPQLLRDGFALVARDGLAVTDDASIVEALGQPVFITKGEYTNLKARAAAGRV